MILSYSKYSTYEKCPRKFKFRYMDKLEEPKGDAMSRGTVIHNSVEDFLLGKVDQLHPDIHSYYGQFFTALRDAGAIPEEKIAVDRNWKLTDWDSPDAYCRSVLDIRMPMRDDGEVQVFELKTGKIYPEHYDQRELYAVKVQALLKDAKMIKVTGIYLDLKKNSPTYLHPHYYQEPKIELWASKFRTILRDELFIPNPTFSCRFCHFRKDNGGPCEF
jgi:CRISPR/Cas system-associated exonuclease Cas4 (RecB family)